MVYVGELLVEHLPRNHVFILVQVNAPYQWANDSWYFLLENFDRISQSPSQIYLHALPFSPSSSWVRKCYGAELTGVVKVVKGLVAEWGACCRTVALHNNPLSLACWKDTIAVGLESGEIITLSGTTGIQIAILSDHTGCVVSLTFSSDGISLVSGSGDQTIKLWDVQTGGVARSFHGHTGKVHSVSISVDSATIASGSHDDTIRLWDTQTGRCHRIIKQWREVKCVIFSPTHSKYLMSVSNGQVQQWDIDGHRINDSQKAYCAALSSDGTQLVLCQGTSAVVQNFDSGLIRARLFIPNSIARHCCLSPDNRLVAVANWNVTIYIWDITGSDPHPVETLVGHTDCITSLVFSSPSSLITSSADKSARFWQIVTTPIDPVVGYPKFTPLAPVPMRSTTLQANDGIFVSSDLDGMVSTWDISTGLLKTSLQTPAKNVSHGDVRLVNGRLILVWHAAKKLHVWDVENKKLLQEIGAPWHDIYDIKISVDGSRLFCLHDRCIEAYSMWTGEFVRKVQVNTDYASIFLTVNGSRVWANCPSNPVFYGGPKGWDFGIPELPPIWLPTTLSIHLSDTKLWDFGLSCIKDTTTGKVVLQLGREFAGPTDVQLDGCYFLAHYLSGEVLILDFNHAPLW